MMVACINCAHLGSDGRCTKNTWMKWYGCESFKPRVEQ